jgi:hypothetical protein
VFELTTVGDVLADGDAHAVVARAPAGELPADQARIAGAGGEGPLAFLQLLAPEHAAMGHFDGGPHRGFVTDRAQQRAQIGEVGGVEVEPFAHRAVHADQLELAVQREPQGPRALEQ